MQFPEPVFLSPESSEKLSKEVFYGRVHLPPPFELLSSPLLWETVAYFAHLGKYAVGTLGFEPRVARTRIVHVAVTPCPAVCTLLSRAVWQTIPYPFSCFIAVPQSSR